MCSCCSWFCCLCGSFSFFFFNDTATTEIYTLSLHDALRSPPPSRRSPGRRQSPAWPSRCRAPVAPRDRKSTRLNSSHANISYAVFCLKKKKKPDRWIVTDHKQETDDEAM